MRVLKSQCSLFKDLYRAFLQEEVDVETRVSMEQHMKECAYCREWSKSVDENREDKEQSNITENKVFQEAMKEIKKVKNITLRYVQKKSIKRSSLRLFLGKKYYISKRYIQWCLGKKKYSRNINKELQKNIIFTHSTPLLRRLKDVEMYLQYNKITNLKIAVEKLNRITLRPGETFSYWKLIGKPSYKKGYLDGLILCPDGSFKPGVGGGLCQLSNLIYWMTLHTQLTVTERYRHSHDIFPDVNRTQPFGSGATCVYNYLDLQVYNGTDSEFQLVLEVTKENLRGEWRSNKPVKYYYEIYEKEHSITTAFFGGYMRNNNIYRKVYNLEKELIKDEYITENHAYMIYEPFLSEAKHVEVT